MISLAEKSPNLIHEWSERNLPLSPETVSYVGREVIDCEGYLRVDEKTDKLYAPYSRKFEPRTVRLIPYHCFANRGESDMTVYLNVK